MNNGRYTSRHPVRTMALAVVVVSVFFTFLDPITNVVLEMMSYMPNVFLMIARLFTK